MNKKKSTPISKKLLLELAEPFDIKGAKKMKKEVLIHQLQLAEGNTDCFKRILNCSVSPCFYRDTCQSHAQ